MRKIGLLDCWIAGLLFLAGDAIADPTPVHIRMRDSTGSSLDRTVTFTPLDGIRGFYGTNLVPPTLVTIATHGGIADTNLECGNYMVTYSGLANSQTIFWPANASITNLADQRIQSDGVVSVWQIILGAIQAGSNMSFRMSGLTNVLSALTDTNVVNALITSATNDVAARLLLGLNASTNDVAVRTTAATNDLNTVIRNYVGAGGPFLSLSGGTMSGNISFSGGDGTTPTIQQTASGLTLQRSSSTLVIGGAGVTIQGANFNLSGLAAITNGIVVTNIGGGAPFTAATTNGDSFINPAGNFKTATYGSPTEVNFGTAGIKTNGLYMATSNEVDIANNGTNVVQVTNGTVVVKGPMTVAGTISGNVVSWSGMLNVASNGVANDGVTDSTTTLQALLNRGGGFYFPAGTYLLQEIRITNNSRLLGDGAVLKYASGAANTNIFVSIGTNTGVSIEGFDLSGGWTTNLAHPIFRQYSATGGGSVLDLTSSPDQFGYWDWSKLRHGLCVNGQSGHIKNVTVHGFSGIGVIPVSTLGDATHQTNGLEVSGLNCYSNFCGLFASASIKRTFGAFILPYITNYFPTAIDAQYVNWKGLNCFFNAVGAVVSQGSSTWTGCRFNDNTIGIGEWGGNDTGIAGHGVVNGCLINHNTFAPIYMTSDQSGFLIVNSHIRGNTGTTITISSCSGLAIEHCQLNPVGITCNNTSAGAKNYFRNNDYSGAFSSYTLSNDGGLIIAGNTSLDTSVDTDKSLLSNILTNGIPTGGFIWDTNSASPGNGSTRVTWVTVTNQSGKRIFLPGYE